MTKVLEPALQLRFQQHALNAQAVTVAAMRQLTDAVFEFLFALRARQSQIASERVAQKVKALRRRIHNLGLRRVQRQAVVGDPRSDEFQRLEQAIAQCEQLSQQNAVARKERQKPPRVSTTDPEARVLKFSDNGFRLGYNVHFASDTQSSIIVGDQVTNAGTDHGQLGPMMDQIEQRFGEIPAELLVDGGCATQTEITTLAQRGVKVFSPVKNAAKELAAGKNPYARKRGDTDEVADWRTRMGEAVSQELYKLRSQVAEWVNAVCRGCM